MQPKNEKTGHVVKKYFSNTDHSDGYLLLSRDHLEPLDEDVLGERPEPELGAPRSQRLDDPAHVVADEAEPRGPVEWGWIHCNNT